MQPKLYLPFLCIFSILLVSCSKWLVPEDKLSGTWKLVEVERKRPFHSDRITSGYESGLFFFDENGTATYTDNAGILSGNWLMKRSYYTTYSSSGDPTTNSKLTLDIRLYNFPANRFIDWLFDSIDFRDSGNKLLAKMHGAGYEYRYWFVKQ